MLVKFKQQCITSLIDQPCTLFFYLTELNASCQLSYLHYRVISASWSCGHVCPLLHVQHSRVLPRYTQTHTDTHRDEHILFSRQPGKIMWHPPQEILKRKNIIAFLKSTLERLYEGKNTLNCVPPSLSSCSPLKAGNQGDENNTETAMYAVTYSNVLQQHNDVAPIWLLANRKQNWFLRRTRLEPNEQWHLNLSRIGRKGFFVSFKLMKDVFLSGRGVHFRLI